MTEVVISRQRLRELEICAELASNLLKAIGDADGQIFPMIARLQVVLSQYEARMAVADAMGDK
jgi:hypothetical protein